MESRKITIFLSKDQRKVSIMTTATTLGELKADLRANDISYDSMDFFEGRSKTKLMDDASQLPHDVAFDGGTTNELVVMLSSVNKKIKSGTQSRSEIFTEIKNKGLQDAVKAAFGGRNYTQVSTDDLVAFLAKKSPAKVTAPVERSVAKPVVKEVVKEIVVETPECCVDACKVKNALVILVNTLEENETLSYFEAQEVLCILEQDITKDSESEDGEEDVKGMFGDWSKE